jgi:SAM-dependent methyltransferase
MTSWRHFGFGLSPCAMICSSGCTRNSALRERGLMSGVMTAVLAIDEKRADTFRTGGTIPRSGAAIMATVTRVAVEIVLERLATDVGCERGKPFSAFSLCSCAFGRDGGNSELGNVERASMAELQNSWFWLTARRLTPACFRPVVKNLFDLAESTSERVASTIQRDRIPNPPPKFRALVNGQPIDAENHARIGQELFVLLREHCGLESNSVVLDIGCGCGRVATPLTKYLSEGTYHGIDIIKEMVDWCKANISKRVPNFHFHHADLTNTLYRRDGRVAEGYVFPFNNGMFDVIFATSVFTHLVPTSANQYLREIARLLKPGTGRAFLTFYLTNDGVRQQGRPALPFYFPSMSWAQRR